MTNNLLFLLLTANFLADFYFQTDYIATNKCKSKRIMLLHIGLYFALNCSIMLFYGYNIFGLVAMVTVSHFIIDIVKCYIVKISNGKNNSTEWYVFIYDQFLHVILVIISYVIYVILLNSKVAPTTFAYVCDDFFNENGSYIIKVFLSIVIILNPISVLMRTFLKTYEIQVGDTYNNGEGLRNAGSLIGKLERLIIFTFILLNAYSAIGFVLVAKSIFRYENITKSSNQSEYYLVGTLLSSLCVFITYYILYTML